MKAMQKFIHLCLIVATLLAAVGFKVNVPHCAEEIKSPASLMADAGCCCDKTQNSPVDSCPDMACVMQRGVFSITPINSYQQQESKSIKALKNYPEFSVSIRPLLANAIPHFALPLPVSGRFIRILHQTFLL